MREVVSAVAALGAVLAALLACGGAVKPGEMKGGAQPASPYIPTTAQVNDDPDTLYAAAVRVFLRRGWGFQSRDDKARAVETEWVPFSKLGVQGLDGPPPCAPGQCSDEEAVRRANTPVLRASFRVLISIGRIEVFTSCSTMTSTHIDRDHGCDNGQRPAGTGNAEANLVREIVHEAHTL